MSLSNFVKRIRNIMRNDAGINGDAQRIEQMAWMLFLKVYDEKENDWEMEDDYQSIIPEECRWRNWAHDDGSGNALTGDDLLSFVNNVVFDKLKKIEITPDTPIRQAIVKTTFEDANQYMKDGVQLRQVLNVIDDLDLGNYEESHAFGEIYESILKEMQSAGSSGEFYREEFNQSVYGIEKKQFPYMLCVTNLLLHGIDKPLVFHDNSLTKDVLNYTEGDQFDVVLMNPPYGGNEKADVKSHFPSDMRSSETADLFMVLIMYRLKKNGRAAVIVPDGFLFGADNTKIAIKTKLLRDFNLHTIIRLPGSIFSPYTPIATNILFFNNEKADDSPIGYSTKETWCYRLDMPEGYKHFSKTKPMRLEHCNPIKEWWNDRKDIIIEDGNEKARCYSVEDLIGSDCNFDLCKFPKEDEEILPPAELLADYYKKRAALDHEIDKTLAEIQRILGIELPQE